MLYGCADPIATNQQGPICCQGGGSDKSGASAAGEPINLSNGNMYETATDFATSGQDPFTAQRFYNSNLSYGASPPTAYASSHSFLFSRFGYGWRSEYDRFVVSNASSPGPATVVDAIRADGTGVHFVWSGGHWVSSYYSATGWTGSSDPRHNIDIRMTNDSTYYYITDGQDTVEKYDSTGKLITATYRNGYQQTFTYDASNNNTVVTDTFGRTITFYYLANGLAYKMTDSAGHDTLYSYVDRAPSSGGAGADGLWVLQAVTFPDTTSVTYGYTDTNPINNFALTSITDENGHTFASWTYDATSGRALTSQNSGTANLTTVAYNDIAGTRTVTNALGKQWIYNVGTFQSRYVASNIAGQASTHTAAATTSYAYDTNGFVSQITDGNSNVTKYTNNTIGQETSRTEGYGSAVARTVSTAWNSTWREPDQIVEPNLTTDFTYDVSGKLTQLKQTDTTTTSVPYVTAGQTRIWAFTYSTGGLLHTVDGPLSGTGDTITYAYTTDGYVNSITDQLGHVTSITSLDGWGHPLTSVDPNSVTTNYTYDGRGRILTVTRDPGANQSQYGFTYDAAGNLTVITMPDASTLTYAYDNSHRVTSVTNNLGESVTYTLDDLGGRTATVVRAATSTITKQQSATFDELGRVMADIGAASQTTSHAYDLDDNEITTTDPRSKVYGHAFDALNRLHQETDPDSFTTVATYNGKNDVTGVTDARSLVTAYVRDGFGDAIRQTSPDTGITDFWYDANGKVTKQVDARSVEADFTYDTAGRVLTKTFPAASAENVSFTYDATAGGNKGVGRLTSLTDQSGSDALVYDAQGRVASDTRVIGSNTYATAYGYDPSGHVLTETYPSGRIVTYTRDALGRISGVTTKQTSGSSAVTVGSSVTYEPFGPLHTLGFGNGLTASLSYDQDYQLTGLVTTDGTTAVQNLTYGDDPSGNITSIADGVTPSRSQSLSYDDLNRVTTASGLYGSQSYTYDGVGNRTARTVGAVTDTYAIASGANQVSTITTGANVRSFTYLASGQVSQDVRDATHTYGFTANKNGRNASASLNGTTVGSYLYNAYEQRVQKIAGGATVQFVYDLAGHLIEEADGSGNAIREYIWLDDLPVAMLDDTGVSPVLYYIHTDQLGTPQKITDGTKTVAWDAAMDPFGNPVSILGTLTNNLRFPGQYADAETALNQNWNRDYDPTLGRYVQSDPMGIYADINTYEYVYGNPVSFTDPTGLGIKDWSIWPWNWWKKKPPSDVCEKKPDPEREKACIEAFVDCLWHSGRDQAAQALCAEAFNTCTKYPELTVKFPRGKGRLNAVKPGKGWQIIIKKGN